MRIRIVRQPTEPCIDGVQLDRFLVGHLYDVGTTLASVMLAEGWAEPVDPVERAGARHTADDRPERPPKKP